MLKKQEKLNMKKISAIILSIVGVIIAILTANSGLVKKQKKKIAVLKEKKKDLELKEAVLIDNARDAKKKTIESKEELANEVKKISDAYGDSVDDLISFIESGKRKA